LVVLVLLVVLRLLVVVRLVVELLLVELLLVDEVAVVVVTPGVQGPVKLPGKLSGSAGLVAQSSSRRSNTPSRSRSTPIRTPVPSGTAVKVSSWPAAAAWFRRFVVEIVASAWRSLSKVLPPTYT